MSNAAYRIPEPVNEPVLNYAPDSPERAELRAEITRQAATEIEIPLIINGQEVRTGNTVKAIVPHNHGQVLATVHLAGEKEIEQAVKAALAARHEWSNMPHHARASIFLKAADLLVGPWRQKLNASTVLNQSKTCHQAEVDAACEFIDFFRFNCKYMEEIYAAQQNLISPPGLWNRMECRGLEGFVYAITPFNFTSIAGNIPHAPALMGNTVVWKPSPHSLLSNYFVMRLFEAAGLPAGVINFIPGDAASMSAQLFAHPEFAGVHYTGSTAVFRGIWQQIGENISNYHNYPRIVGETGGKDFIFAHTSADPAALITAMVRGAYEFQGQKCSAASRAYVPKSIWAQIRGDLIDTIRSIRMGDVADYSNFMGAVIHQAAFDRCRDYIEKAKASSEVEILTGGECDDSTGYFVAPTLIETKSPTYATMCEEIFGPVLSVHVYEDHAFEEMLQRCDQTSPYALTGAIFANDRAAVETASKALRYSAGNFYINDKPTGAVVGQQPFGGARASGTNDKAGSALNLIRWMSPRTVKETFNPPTDYRYPYMK